MKAALQATYLEDGTDLLAMTERLVSRIPGIARNKRAAMSEALLGNLVVEGLSWTRDPGLGWINNWIYSQRNPASKLSVLKPPDFAYIQRFFH